MVFSSVDVLRYGPDIYTKFSSLSWYLWLESLRDAQCFVFRWDWIKKNKTPVKRFRSHPRSIDPPQWPWQSCPVTYLCHWQEEEGNHSGLSVKHPTGAATAITPHVNTQSTSQSPICFKPSRGQRDMCSYTDVRMELFKRHPIPSHAHDQATNSNIIL